MKKNIIFLFITILAISSCKNYLDEELVGTVSYDYYDTDLGMEDLIKGAYVSVRWKYAGEQSFSLYEYGVDEVIQANDGQFKYMDMYTSQFNSQAGYIHDMWTEYYRAINTCNLGIERIPAIKGVVALQDDAKKNQRIAELRFLRAFYYFELVQQFGKIPLVLKGDIGVRLEFPRAEISEVYTQIISDLSFAESVLPATQGEKARATKGAAQHYLAKVYLTRGSAVTHQRGQQPTDMDSTVYWANKVINSGLYKLQSNFSDLWKIENEDKLDETVWAASFTGPDFLLDQLPNRTHLYYGMVYETSMPGMTRDLANGRPFRRIRPSDYTYDVFDRKNDSRFYKSVKMTWFANTATSKLKIGDTAIYLTLHTKTDVPQMKNKAYTWIPKPSFTTNVFPTLLKHLDPNRSSVNSELGSRDGLHARLAETYLIAAEAYGRKGEYSKAADLVNVLRKRAAWKSGEVKTQEYWLLEGGTKGDLNSTESSLLIDATYWDKDVIQEQYPATATNQQSRFIHFILNERARELLGEFHRWTDLARTETLVERVKKFNIFASPSVQPFHMLRPIPQEHLDRIYEGGKKLTAEESQALQNPGY